MNKLIFVAAILAIVLTGCSPSDPGPKLASPESKLDSPQSKADDPGPKLDEAKRDAVAFSKGFTGPGSKDLPVKVLTFEPKEVKIDGNKCTYRFHSTIKVGAGVTFVLGGFSQKELTDLDPKHPAQDISNGTHTWEGTLHLYKSGAAWVPDSITPYDNGTVSK